MAEDSTNIHRMKKFFGALALAAVFLGAAVAAADDSNAPFKLGGIFSLSGYGAVGGQAELRGVELAVDEINASGGIKGHPIKIVVEDDRSDLKATAVAMHKLAAVDHVPVVIGPNWSEFAEVAADIAEQSKIVMLTPSGYTMTLTTNRPFVFSALENHGAAIKPLSDLIVSRKPTKVAVVLAENTFFRSLYDSIKPQLASGGISIWNTFTFNPGDDEFRSVITKLKSEKVDAVIMLLLESGLDYQFLKQAKELSLPAQIYSADSIPYDEALLKDLAVANGAIFFDYTVATSPEFKARYLAHFHSEAHSDSARSYDLVYLLKQSVEECGASSDEIRECLTRLTLHGVSGDISFDSSRNLKILKPVSKLYTVQDAKIVPFGS